MSPSRLNRMLLLAALCCCLTTGQSMARGKCSPEREREMDECAAKMGFLGDHSFEVPQNSSSMDAFCVQLKSSIGCIQSYARECLTGFTRSMLTSLVKRGKQQSQAICQSPATKSKMTQSLSCLAGKRMTSLHRQMDASVARFEYISDQVAPDRKLNSLCCSYHIFNRDLELALDKVCGQRAGAKEYIKRIVSGTAGEFFDLICGDFKSIGECQSKTETSEIHRKLEDISLQVTSGALKPRNKSLIPVLLRILNHSP